MYSLIRSPLAYQGSKYKLLPEIFRTAGKFNSFHDVFGGSATVALNACQIGNTYYNEWDENVYSILKCLQSAPSAEHIIRRLDRVIREHKLDREDDPAYYRFRKFYNANPSPFLLWVISKHSFSSLIRFNDSGGFNLPFGCRSPQKSEQRDNHIREVWIRLQSIRLHNLPYLKYMEQMIKKADKRHVFYFDPPYLASGANVYKGKWTQADDDKLHSLLDYMNEKGLRWVYSNVTRHRKHENKVLYKWMRDYTVSYPVFQGGGEAYSLNRAADVKMNKTVEVMIKNF